MLKLCAHWARDKLPKHHPVDLVLPPEREQMHQMFRSMNHMRHMHRDVPQQNVFSRMLYFFFLGLIEDIIYLDEL